MAMRKLQIYVTERQYRRLEQWAGEGGSIAGVVREMIDRAGEPADVERDPFYRHVMAEKAGGGEPYGAERAKREFHAEPG